jgi:hypothetical protein
LTKPRASLRLRFGAELLLRLDQAFGNANEALPSLIPIDVPRVELKFAEPVGDPGDYGASAFADADQSQLTASSTSAKGARESFRRK